MDNKFIQIGISGSTFSDNTQIDITQTIKQPSPIRKQPILSNIRQGSKNFIGWEEELELIHTKLQTEQGIIVCAVEGMGGVGKSELALQYAEKYQQNYTARYCLSIRESGLAKAVIQLASPYLSLPDELQGESIETQAEWYWLNWLPAEGNLLVILDDVPHADSIPDNAMPLEARVKVLVTTRERTLNVNFEAVPLDVLSLENAIKLLGKIVGIAKVEKEKETAEAICHSVGYLPLGIELLGEYLAKNRHLTFAKLQQWLSLADESLSRERKSKFYGYRGVEAAIKLSWDDLNNASQRVAMLLGLFAPVETQWKLVEDIAENAGINEEELEAARGHMLKMIK